VMQRGHSKDHRPDLPQLKVMAAAAEPSGHLIACDVHAGQWADDPLYTPLLQRVRGIVGRPEGNITGMSNFVVELPGKQLELLKEAVPRSTRVAVLTNPDTPSHGLEVEHLGVAAKALGVHAHVVPLRRHDELAGAFAAMAREGAEALVVLGEPLLIDRIIGPIVDLAAQSRLPAIYRWRSQAHAGGLMSYGPNQPAIWRRYAYYVHRLLQGATPADLPVEQPTKFELIINLKTAKALGLTMPPSLLLLADEVLQ